MISQCKITAVTFKNTLTGNFTNQILIRCLSDQSSALFLLAHLPVYLLVLTWLSFSPPSSSCKEVVFPFTIKYCLPTLKQIHLGCVWMHVAAEKPVDEFLAKMMSFSCLLWLQTRSLHLSFLSRPGTDPSSWAGCRFHPYTPPSVRSHEDEQLFTPTSAARAAR